MNPNASRLNRPDGVLIQLGIIGFLQHGQRRGHVHLSGIYFKDVVHAPASLVVLGYTSSWS